MGATWLLFQFFNFVLFANSPKKSHVTDNLRILAFVLLSALWNLEELLNIPLENNHEEMKQFKLTVMTTTMMRIDIGHIVSPKLLGKLINF
jgi:hypothetical protein